jgi:hypothetical protein
LLEVPETLSVGVHAQSPFGEGVRARFSEVELLDRGVEDYRSGE